MRLWALLIAYVTSSAAGLLMIKGSFNRQGLISFSPWKGDGLFRLSFDWSFIMGFLLYALGFLIWLYILNKWDLSLAFPVASGALYIGLLFGSAFLLHENIGFVRVAGILFILAGVVLVSRS